MQSINFIAREKTRAFSKMNKRSMNLSEVRIWMILKSSVYGFRRQQTIGNFIVDFASISHHIVVEMDGISHDQKMEYDSRREEFIIKNGYKILKFVGRMPYPNSEICDYVWSKIFELEIGNVSIIEVDM